MTTPDPKELLVMKAYALIGVVATNFATLEFQLQFLIGALVSGRVMSAEVMILIGNKSFSEKIRVMNEMAILRIAKVSPLRSRTAILIRQLETLRNTRNMFIHGYWLVNYPLILTTGGVSCANPKWRFNAKTEEWKSMDSKAITLEELENINQSIVHAIEEMSSISKALEAEQKQKAEQAGPGHPPQGVGSPDP